MAPLGRRIYRERRRMSVFAVLMALSCLGVLCGPLSELYGLTLTPGAVVMLGVGLVACAFLFCLLVPAHRFLVEAAALVLLLIFPLLPRLSEAGPDKVSISVGYASFFILGVLGMYRLIYGGWSARLLRLGTHTERARSQTRLDAQDLWLALLPCPQMQDFYHDDTVIEMTAVGDPSDALLMVHALGEGLFLERELRFEKLCHGRCFQLRYRMLGRALGAWPECPGYTIQLVPHEQGLQVYIIWEWPHSPAYRRLRYWMDDWAGRQLDRMIQQAEAKMARIEELARADENMVRQRA